MKQLFVIVLLSLGLCCYSQSPFKGFLKPIDRGLLQTDTKENRVNLWTIRPVLQVSAMQFLFGDSITVSSFSSIGTGICYTNIISQNGKPYNNFSANLLILFTTGLRETELARISIAASISFLNYVSIGAGYALYDKKFFLLTGVTYNFN